MKKIIKNGGLVLLGLLAAGVCVFWFGARYPGARALTSQEKIIAVSVFGDMINSEAPRVAFDTPYSFGVSKTLGNTIHMNSKNFISQESLDYKTLLIHELGHVWQYQSRGWEYAPKSIWAQIAARVRFGSRSAAYDWKRAFDAGSLFSELNPEQQAEAIAEYFYFLELGEAATKEQLRQREILSCFIPFLVCP